MEQGNSAIPPGKTPGMNRTRNIRPIAVGAASIVVLSLAAAGITTLVRAQSPRSAASGAPDSANSPGSSPATAGIVVETIEVESQELQDKVRVSGQVEAFRIATVAAEAGERVVGLPINRGTRVAQGTLLAQLNDALARQQAAEAAAGLAQAKAGRRQAEAEYARAVVETDAARQAARAQVAQAKAGAAQAKAQVTQASEGERKARSYTRAQELQQAKAGLRQAQADEDLQKAEYDRFAYLLKEGVVGQQAFDRIAAAYKAAKAGRESAEQAVSLATEGARQEDIEAAAAQVAQASAAVSNYEAKQREAEAALRIANTRDTRLETIRRQIEGLRAQENRATAALAQAQIFVRKHRVLAPFTGRVLEKKTEIGEMLSPGAPVATIGDIAQVKVTFQVPERARLGLKKGQSVTVSVDALPGKSFAGVVETVGYQADSRARTFPVEVRLENPKEVLLPNMVARLELSMDRFAAKKLRIPVTAVASDGTTSYVFLVEGGKAVRRNVVTGTVLREQVEIESGLSEGSSVVATPQRLTEGAAVTVVAGGTK
ncbi:MAG: hypothetical protein OHK0029_13590 [Armatimonadaceae bacterium]